jgi:hypothetical protein
LLSEGLPLYLRSAVTKTALTPLDLLAGAPLTALETTSDPTGFWLMPKVPSRVNPPFYIFAAGQGELTPQAFSPPPQIPPTQYLPTVTARPINTLYSTCTGMEAMLIGNTGVLEATAKYLTITGRPTVVSDFLDPTRYHSVTVIGMYHAGNGAVRAPADGISLEGTSGSGVEIFYIDWAPPGVPPDTLRSARGYIVTDAPTSPVGFAVVLSRATSPIPDKITYKFKDTKTDAVARRPWQFPTIAEPPHPGIVTFIGAQMRYQNPTLPLYSLGIPFWLCLPSGPPPG